MNKELLIKFLNESGSDKQLDHNYAIAYEKFISGINVKNFLEIGISNKRDKKTSLWAWKNIFPDAHIYGIDNDITKMIDGFDGISTFWCNQASNNDLQKFLIDCNNVLFDVILDDGSHVFQHAAISFINLFDNLAEGGVYLIEDIQKLHNSYYQNINQWIIFLEQQKNIKYDILDCKPESKDDDSIVIAIWRK